MKLAEGGEDGLRPKPKSRRAPRMPGRPGVGEDLQIGDRRAGSFEQAPALRPWRRTHRTARALPDCQSRGACRRRAAATGSDARHRRDSGGRSRTAAPRLRRGRGCGARRRSARAAATGRITFMSSLIGLASRQSPPPKAAASPSEMKLQVTASSSPRAAAVRRTLRSISWQRVAVGLATPATRGRAGVDGTSS